MNRDDIIRMARVAGCHDNGEEFRFVELHYLERFARLVYEATFRDANIAASRTILDAAVLKEREACAQIADAHASIEGIAQRIAAEIRGQQ